MTANAESQSISMEYELPYPPVKVWRALTEPELLAEWLMVTDMRPPVGESFTFKADPTPWWDGIVHCEVLELEQSGFLPANAFAFDGASKGWRRMVGKRLSEVLARVA